MIDISELTKRYGDTLAVDDLSFTVRPGQVTGFLGPNGAGKSTTMRMIVGLDRPDRGSASVKGFPYAQHIAPLREVGALLEAKSVHKGRSARNHLLALAQTHGIPARRVDEVLATVEQLTDRERDVLAELVRGRANGEIAAELFVSEATVKVHVGRILAKLGLRDRVQVVVYAYENGIVHPGAP